MKLVVTSILEQLYQLFASQTEEAIEFRKNIRYYKSMFSFTSFGVSLDKDLASFRQCIYIFRAYGKIYYDFPTLVLEKKIHIIFNYTFMILVMNFKIE